jgi:hypothetical protein
VTPQIQLPDGTIGHFPDDMPDAEIAEVLARQFPPSIPDALEPGEQLVLGNGAKVSFNQSISRYIALDWAGRACGFRRTLQEAVELANGQPPPKPEKKREPAQLAPDGIPRDALAVPPRRAPRVHLSRPRHY